ncbi:hypothetical protein Q5752_005009 [Cryptotrichosporon argae]
MAEHRRDEWDATIPSTHINTEQKLDNEAVAQAAAIAARIAASLRPGVAGNELVKRDPGQDGFVKDIEVNDLRNRYALTRATTITQIQDETGASVQVKGVWAPDRTRLPPGQMPLYLHIAATSQIVLDAAVQKVNDLINQELGPLIDDRTLIARNRALGLPPPAEVMQRGRQKWPEDKLPIGLESLRNFNVRAKIVGPGGMFMKYIQAETGSRVQIKGRGSGFMESDTGRESDEPMHIGISAPTEDQVKRARILAEDLLVVLRIEYDKARGGPGGGGVYQQGHGSYQQAGYAGPPQGQEQQHGGYYGNGPAGGGPHGQQQQQQPQQAQQQGGPQVAQSGAAPGGVPAEGSEAWQQYAAYWAAYGYDVNDPQFQAWQAQQYAQGAQQ